MAGSDIAIVGMACLFPGAADLGQFWSNLVNGVDAISEMPASRWPRSRSARTATRSKDRFGCVRGGFVPEHLWFDPLRFGVVPNAVRHGSPDQFVLMKLADEALRDAGVAADASVRGRTDIIIGTGCYANYTSFKLLLSTEGIDVLIDSLNNRFPELTSNFRQELEQQLRETFPPMEIDAISTVLPNLIASRTANRLNLRGSAYVVDGACASSLIAVDHAIQNLRTGRCDLALAGGISLQNCLTMQQGFRMLGALSKTGRSMPFDKRADGIVVGEGAGVIVLKRLNEAIKDSNRIYAVIRGVGVSSDGRDVDVMAPSASGQLETYSIAYRDAGVDPETIGYLEAHGTATTVGDRTELASLRAFFGAPSGPAYGRSMGSVKSMIGHLLPASGMASLIKTALALSNKVIPLTLNCEEPCDEVAEGPFHIASETRAWIHAPAGGPRRAAINIFGFGGINSHLILEELQSGQRQRSSAARSLPRPVVAATARPTELVVVSGATVADVLARLERLRSFVLRDGRGVGLADIAAAMNAELNPSHPCKLACVACNLDELLELIVTSALFLSSNSAKPDDNRLYYSEAAAKPPGKIACIIPGIGFPGLSGSVCKHLMELALHFPALRQEFDRFEASDQRADDSLPLSVLFDPPTSLPEEFRAEARAHFSKTRAGSSESDQDQRDERAIVISGTLITNWFFWVLTRALDIPFDMMAGQSTGELTALCASGAMKEQDYIQLIWSILRIDFQIVPGLSIAMASITAEQFEDLRGEQDNIHIVTHVTPDLLLIGGALASVDPIVRQLQTEGVIAVLVPLPPLHTPYMSELRGPVRVALEAVSRYKQPRIPVYSSSSADLIATERDALIEQVCDNLDHPCRSWQMLQRMADDGARIFVHVGQGALKGLPQLDDIITVPIDLEVCDPLTQLNHFCATLLTAGVPLNLDLLADHRPICRLNLDEPQASIEPPASGVPYCFVLQPLNSDDSLQSDCLSPQPPHWVWNDSMATSDSAGTAVQVPADGSNDRDAEGSREHSESMNLDHHFPFVGSIEHLVPQQSLRYVLQLSFAEHQFIAHHRFIAADGIKPLSRLEATLPLTFSMELMAEAAALLSPGLGLIGLEQVRGSKWIQFDDCDTLDLNVEARVTSIDSQSGVQRVDVKIQLQGSIAASGTVLFASNYCHPPSVGPVIATNDPPWPFTAKEAYATRRLFHGPMFEGISRLIGYGNPTFSAELVVLPKDTLFASTHEPGLLLDPLLLDAVGQVVGLWWVEKGIYPFPIVVDSVEIHSPSPLAGSLVRLNGQIMKYNPETSQTEANFDVDDGDGNLWLRISGWTNILPENTPEFFWFTQSPADHYISREIVLPDIAPDTVCTMVVNSKLRQLKKLATQLLHLEEEAEYEAIVDRSRRRDFLISRLAIKDAIRLWWMRRGADPIHPATIRIDHDPRGRPFVSQDGEPVLPWISLSHSDGAAVAIASDMEIGIDLEPLANRDAQLNGYASDIEKALLAEIASQAPDEGWELRLWCAKEAAAKACGTGFQGRPRDFALVAGHPDGVLLIEQAATAERFRVRSFLLEQHLIAIARLHAGESGDRH